MPGQHLVKSISYNQHEIIADIIRLYCPHGIDVDATYSTGKMYKGIKEPKHKFDLKPQVEGCSKGDSRKLPLKNKSVKSIMFDPPFLATTGQSLRKMNDSNKLNKRFGVYASEQELRDMYCDSLKEFYRILVNNGILIFKCQDKVSSGKQYWNHCWIYQEAIRSGYVVEDLFILLAKNRLVADWQARNQKHARKFHCYFWVFRKKGLN